VALRPRIHWQELDSVEVATWWTPGWLPDTSTLRWSLANDLRVEGVTDGWHKSFEASEAATFYEGYVHEDEEGNFVYTTPEGVLQDGERVRDYRPATFARLDEPVCD